MDRRDLADLRKTARTLLALADEVNEAADLEPGPGLADDADWATSEAYTAFAANRYADACRHAMRALQLLVPTLDPQARPR